eukprot:TRINITY_DN4203_c0_g1_i2.p1 TRINITY_DN4203_c0_g1~~TRINITY_DN4203_c0_g1_i2.p1  ORF type:complete len:462 (+),score=139.70 TRINITY_DN4203_c0_g1_i2:298-1683(+)
MPGKELFRSEPDGISLGGQSLSQVMVPEKASFEDGVPLSSSAGFFGASSENSAEDEEVSFKKKGTNGKSQKSERNDESIQEDVQPPSKKTKKQRTVSAEPRKSHKAIEKERRQKINEKISELRELVEITDGPQLSRKAQVLQATIEKIDDMRDSCTVLVTEHEKLQQEKAILVGLLEKARLGKDLTVSPPRSPQQSQQQSQQQIQPQPLARSKSTTTQPEQFGSSSGNSGSQPQPPATITMKPMMMNSMLGVSGQKVHRFPQTPAAPTDDPRDQKHQREFSNHQQNFSPHMPSLFALDYASQRLEEFKTAQQHQAQQQQIQSQHQQFQAQQQQKVQQHIQHQMQIRHQQLLTENWTEQLQHQQRQLHMQQQHHHQLMAMAQAQQQQPFIRLPTPVDEAHTAQQQELLNMIHRFRQDQMTMRPHPQSGDFSANQQQPPLPVQASQPSQFQNPHFYFQQQDGT